MAAPSTAQPVRASIATRPCGGGIAIVKTSARIATNEIGPARGPQASVIADAKPISAATSPSAIGYGLSSSITVAATQPITAAVTTRCQVRRVAIGRSARLA